MMSLSEPTRRARSVAASAWMTSVERTFRPPFVPLRIGTRLNESSAASSGNLKPVISAQVAMKSVRPT